MTPAQVRLQQIKDNNRNLPYNSTVSLWEIVEMLASEVDKLRHDLVYKKDE